jgi:hypothetical protein
MFHVMFSKEKKAEMEKTIYVNRYHRIEYSSLEDMLANLDIENDYIDDIGHDNFYIKNRIVDNLAYSRYYRRLLRENDADTVVSLLAKESPTLAAHVDLAMLKAGISKRKKGMADFDIVRLPVTADVVVNGVTYHGKDDLKRASRNPQSGVCNRWEGFPCFDSYDYADENRCYNNYCFCTKESNMWQKVSKMEPQNGDFCLIGERMPKAVLPMVYVNDEAKTLLLACQG